MRKVFYSAAVSLDGFIARLDGSYDWIPEDPSIDWAAFMARFDTVLMGRRTYEMLRKSGSPPMKGMETVVFSRTLKDPEPGGVRVVAEGAGEEVRRMRAQDGKAIWLMGGGQLFRSLLDAGQVDLVEIGLVPALLGEGIPMVAAGSASHRLELEESRTTEAGLILATYRVATATA